MRITCLRAPERLNEMGFVVPLCVFALGFAVGGCGGIVIGFVWYERRCGLLSDHSGERAAVIRWELDDVFGRSVPRIRPTPLPDANWRFPRG
jgi:hypothetical protein